MRILLLPFITPTSRGALNHHTALLFSVWPVSCAMHEAAEHVPCSIAEWKTTLSFTAGCGRKGKKGAVRAGGAPQNSE